MSWSYEFFAENVEDLLKGVRSNAGRAPEIPFLQELTWHVEKAAAFLRDHEGIGWVVKAYGHVGGYDGFNFTFEVKPVNTMKNHLSKRANADDPTPASPRS